VLGNPLHQTQEAENNDDDDDDDDDDDEEEEAALRTFHFQVRSKH
jgi:hypothetical protein